MDGITTELKNEVILMLIEKSREAQDKSYSPYSNVSIDCRNYSVFSAKEEIFFFLLAI